MRFRRSYAIAVGDLQPYPTPPGEVETDAETEPNVAKETRLKTVRDCD